MSDTRSSVGQQTAYQRWEMSSFGQADDRGGLTHSKRPDPAVDSQVAQALESIRQEAFTKGLQEGFAVGMAKAKELSTQQAQDFVQLTAAFEQGLMNADHQIEAHMLALALDIAKAMLKTQLNINPEIMLPIVQEAIHYSPTVVKPARIIVHHDDAQILRHYLAEELAEQSWQILEDNMIERGGCIVETGTNQIDATNATRWKRIADALAQHNNWLEP